MIAASRRNRPISATGLSACLVLAVGWSSAHAQDRVYVLDTTGQALLAVDLRTGQPTTRTPLDVAAKELLASPDQAHLVALAPGAHKATFCCGYQPKSPITATVFDADTLQKTAGVEVGWGMPTITVAGFELLSPRAALLPSVDGRRVTILCAGYRSKKPEETLPRELVTIELDSGRVAGRVALDRPVELVGRVADTETAVLLAEAQTGKEPMAAEIILADLTQQAVTERIRLEGAPTRPFITADGGWLYLLDPGKPSNKKDKNVDGSLHVVSLRERKLVATVGAGSDPRTFFWDEDRQLALLPSDGPPVEKGETRKGSCGS